MKIIATCSGDAATRITILLALDFWDNATIHERFDFTEFGEITDSEWGKKLTARMQEIQQTVVPK